MFGEEWNYMVALEAKALEGFYESGLQLILQTYIQKQTNWPLIQPLLGPREKGVYFPSTNPSKID